MLIEHICARVCQETVPTAADHAAASRAFEDTLAVALAGWHEPVAKAARRYASGDVHPLIDGSGALSAEHAAFVHGVAGHALDYDDVHLISLTHPSVVIVPALLALAPLRARERSLFAAYAVGVSVNIALGRVLGFEHYARGWHATSTIGPLAAAAAGCHLLALDEERARSALALAASQAAGLQRNFGSMAKPVQAGNAAAAGVRAVLLAADGVSGDADIFAEQGFVELYGGGSSTMPALSADDVRSVSLKLYPCCYATHRLIGAVFGVRAAYGACADLSKVERIELRAPVETMKPLRVIDPRTGNQGKFCAAYVLAVALLQGHVGFSDFTDEAVARADVRALMERIRHVDDVESGRAGIGLQHGQVEVRLFENGRRTVGACAAFPGSPEAPATDDEFAAKLAQCAAVYASRSGRAFTCSDVRDMVVKLSA